MKTFNLFILFFTLCTCWSKISKAQGFKWAKQLGVSISNYSINDRTLTTDDTGNLYTTGSFTNTVDFDPGAGTFYMSPIYGKDIFVQKLDSSGNFIWARKMSGGGNELGSAIAVDGSGNVFTTGNFGGTVDFDPGNGINNQISAGSGDIFIHKLNANGDFEWVKKFGGAGFDYGKSVAIDDFGNIYISGIFEGTVDFDPGPNVSNISAFGYQDIFILKLDNNGTFIWAKQLGGMEIDEANSLTIDKNGNIIITGKFSGNADFDPSSGTYLLNASGSSNAIVVKLNMNGQLIWAKQIEGSNESEGFSIATDSNANVYCTGIFKGTVDIDPNNGIFNLISNGSEDIYILKLDEYGTLVWANQIGGSLSDNCYSIGIDKYANVMATGTFQGIVDFDPSPGIFNANSIGADIFVLKLDANGIFKWVRQMGSPNISDVGQSIVADKNENVITFGYFGGTVDFNPGPGVFNLSCPNTFNLFIQKLKNCTPIIDTIIVEECYSYTWENGITYTNSTDSAIFTYPLENGCEASKILHLTIKSVSDLTTSVNGATINSNNLNASNFQWLDCNNNFNPIQNATNISYTAIEDGSYAVELIENGCIDTSDCVIINTIGVKNIKKSELKVNLYPNPTNSTVQIDFEKEQKDVQLIMTDVLGKEILNKKFKPFTSTNIALNEASGIYFLKIKTKDGQKIVKVIKE